MNTYTQEQIEALELKLKLQLIEANDKPYVREIIKDDSVYPPPISGLACIKVKLNANTSGETTSLIVIQKCSDIYMIPLDPSDHSKGFRRSLQVVDNNEEAVAIMHYFAGEHGDFPTWWCFWDYLKNNLNAEVLSYTEGN